MTSSQTNQYILKKQKPSIMLKFYTSDLLDLNTHKVDYS